MLERRVLKAVFALIFAEAKDRSLLICILAKNELIA